MIKKALITFCSLYALVLLSAFALRHNSKGAGLNTIILDAGHGGKDPGARGWNGNYEKNIALAITLKLGKELEKKIPGVKIHYTRTDDSYPTLYDRSNLANEKKGDLFISIHCNAREPIYRREANGTRTETYYVGKGRKKKKMTREVTVYKTVKYPNMAKGLETYVFAAHKTEDKVHAIAEAENAEIFNDPNYKDKYGGGLDPNSPEFLAKATLRTKRYFQRSVKLAGFVQDNGAEGGRTDGAIRQRGVGIWVLQATAMPSILVETGYVSNPTEEAYLASTEGQTEMADIVAKAVKKYKDDLDAAVQPAGEQPANPGNKAKKLALQQFFLREDEYGVCVV
jgi:N-acetylmuramoyl-L-alanine amidase